MGIDGFLESTDLVYFARLGCTASVHVPFSVHMGMDEKPVLVDLVRIGLVMRQLKFGFPAQPSLETCLNRPLFKSCFLLGFYCLRVSEESRGVTGYGFSGWRSCEELSLRHFFPFLKKKTSHVNFINKPITYNLQP